MEACIMICRMKKKPERKGRILFINAINEVTRKNAQSYLEDKHITKIANAYEAYINIDEFATVATIRDIEENNFSLSIPLYVHGTIIDGDEDMRSLQQHYEGWSQASDIMKLSYQRLNSLLKENEDE
jgi:type I restriction enzyme M protein